ncbi:ORF6N domain-containing protein [Paenibacillus sp. FSL F4-0236]|uniref:ORF6N domain-containing protein n=1 Tax=Paenibacillus sp. FSL F4-0236 TaxID=2954731 RepID=UPI0030FC20DF
MNNPTPIEHNGQRVLTTAQLAESFDTETKIISKNFERNESRYVEGKHFFALKGEELKTFKASRQNDDNLKFAPVIYIWTEKGAWLHAKSLNTDQAWEAYEALVDDYYRVKQLINKPMDPLKALMQATHNLLASQELIVGRVDEIEQKVDKQITLNSGQQRRLQQGINKKVCSIESDKSERSDLFRQLHKEIKDRWEVPSYKDILRQDLQNVLNYISAWKPIRRTE